MMTDEAAGFATELASNVECAGESDGPSSSKDSQSVAVLSMEPEGEGGSHPEASAEPKEHELMNMAGAGVPSNTWDPPSDDFTYSWEDGAMFKPSSQALGGGDASSSLHVDDSEVAATSSLRSVANPHQRSPSKSNSYIKRELMKEVRRFGRKYERIFILLEDVEGPLEIKKQFIEFTIKEAARFKRRDLIQHLEKYLEKVESDHLVNKDNSVQNM